MGERSTQSEEARSAPMLLYLLAVSDFASDFHRFEPALYLAERRLGLRSYSYRLSHGHVVSDELSSEMAQLIAAGVLEPSSRGAKVAPAVLSDDPPVGIADPDGLRQVLGVLLEEEPATLQAAATSAFFEVARIGDPAAHLRWFRELSPTQAVRARELAASMRGVREGGSDSE